VRRPQPAATPRPSQDQPPWVESWNFEVVSAAEDRRQRREARVRRRAHPRGDKLRAGSKTSAFIVLVACAAVIWTGAPNVGTSRVRSASAAALLPLPTSASAYARSDIPGAYLKLYVQAARRYHLDWATLAAVGQIESNHGRSPFPGVNRGTNRAGAAGPTQFLARTWARYGVDGNNDGSISPYDPADAIAAMAAYLRASGGPDDWPRALFAYNHSEAYVIAVLALSRRYEPPIG
jgi:hypothetical protein